MKIEDIENAALDCALFEDYYYNPDLQPAYIDGFTRGANWRIDSVWHEASEEPERNRIYLVKAGLPLVSPLLLFPIGIIGTAVWKNKEVLSCFIPCRLSV